MAATSFFPSKPLGCYGDGGALFTNDEALAERFRELRIHGQAVRYHHPNIGINGRMDTLQAPMTEHNILTAVRNPRPLHLHPAFADLGSVRTRSCIISHALNDS